MDHETVYFKNDFTGENYSIKMPIDEIYSYEQVYEKAKTLFNEQNLNMSVIDGNILSALRTITHEDYLQREEILNLPKPICIYVMPNSDNTDCCCICLDNIIGGGIRTLPCGHVFHQSCFDNRIHSCPICRGPVSNNIM